MKRIRAFPKILNNFFNWFMSCLRLAALVWGYRSDPGFQSCLNDGSSKLIWFIMRSFLAHRGTKTHIYVCDPGTFTSSYAAINVCRSTEKTKCLLGFQHCFVFFTDSICPVCSRFLGLIQVGTICFIHSKQASFFYLVYQLVVVERCFVNAKLRDDVIVSAGSLF